MATVIQMHFTTVDYVIFALLLVASAGIGLFYAFSGGRQRTTQVKTGELCSVLFVASRTYVYGLCSGVLNGGPVHELPARVPVPARHLPVCRGHPWRSVWGVHLWDSVLVLGLLLLSGPAHPGSCLHPGVLQTAAVQRLWGLPASRLLLSSPVARQMGVVPRPCRTSDMISNQVVGFCALSFFVASIWSCVSTRQSASVGQWRSSSRWYFCLSTVPFLPFCNNTFKK